MESLFGWKWSCYLRLMEMELLLWANPSELLAITSLLRAIFLCSGFLGTCCYLFEPAWTILTLASPLWIGRYSERTYRTFNVEMNATPLHTVQGQLNCEAIGHF